MKTGSPLIQFAKLVSIVGHPLLTTSLFTGYVTFQQLPLKNAVIISGLLLGGVVLPISWRNYRKVRQGRFTNFDVSDQRQRYQFYPIVIGLLTLATGLLFATNQPRSFCYGTLFSLILIVGSYLLNFFIKVSLHTSLSFFLAWAMALLSPTIGISMALFSLLIALSRFILKKHTVSEIIAGALLGLTIGASFYWSIR
ncbi:phosphatase PAP2 family protein [Spirosoma validum]|uniref:Phosphatase PAP2 family protein n=1 Tax=Spirosoma validum TaxID=2771355 RepID=A0A927B237_9BACT|nr:phosphatase PAP2 family protein [Spirosoma validum]MBD2753959.1 phosphatase PAP2 family protein [Spirosoma validum]